MRCPECGAIVKDDAHEIYMHPSNEELVQVYCRADCVIDAMNRGYPLKLWNIILTTDDQ